MHARTAILTATRRALIKAFGIQFCVRSAANQIASRAHKPTEARKVICRHLQVSVRSGECMRLLIVEDNARIAEYVGTALRAQGFAVDAVGTGADGDAAIATTSYDAVILDLGLPDVDGLEWLCTLRKQVNQVPILVLTAREALRDLVQGLDTGADDYMRKPFEVEELVARVRALLRRPNHALGVHLSQGNLTLNTSTREVTIDGAAVEVGKRECSALELLLRRAGRVVPKSAIEEALYSFDEELSSNAIEVLIHRLRKRMSDAKADVCIHTLRGVGYILSSSTN
jgi:two-component system, OmpR family, response regulator QseB